MSAASLTHITGTPTNGIRGMIFSAGLGTRFKPWTDKRPKALAPVNGKSLLQRNIEYFQQYGIMDVVVNVHHFADQVIDEIKKNNGWGSSITISDEQDEVLETGGGLMKAKDFFSNNEIFITTNVDVLTDCNIHELLAFHKKRQSLISFGVTKRDTDRYFLFDKEDKLCGWKNFKTSEETIVIDHPKLKPKAYSCVVVFQPEIFSLMPFKGKFSLKDAFLKLAPDQLIAGFDHTGDRWIDVGKPHSIDEAEALFS